MDDLRNKRLHCLTLILLLYIKDVKAISQCPFASGTMAYSSLPEQDHIALSTNKYVLTHPNELSKLHIGLKTNTKIQCAIPPLHCSNDTFNHYYRTLDGSCNNLQHPGFGMAKARYTRMLTPRYSDDGYSPTLSSIGTPLPSARLLSLTLYGEVTLPDNYRTMASLHWGQLVAHDISELTKSRNPKDCCINTNNKHCYPILLPPFDPITHSTGQSCFSFTRTTSDADTTCPKSEHAYAEKISLATAYLDLSFLYGNSPEENRKIRQFHGGLLKTSTIHNRQWPPISINLEGECGEENYQCYSIPDRRNQITPTVMVLHIMFLREHNRIANALAQQNPQYTDEQIFQIARKINIAQYQKITYYDWLPLKIGSTYAYTHNLIHYVQNDEYVNDYDPSVNVAPYAEFSAAAFRYSHNQIPGWFSLVAPYRNQNITMRLSDYFERPENLNFIAHADNLDSLIRGLVTQLQKIPDSNIDVELKYHFNRKAFKEFGTDLKAIDIQRGRDYGLPSYNDFRQYCGLPRAFDWADFSNEISPDKITLMQRLYASPDDVDLNVGGSLESHVPESHLGPVFQCITGKQFLRTRIGDRFFFERDNIYGGFTKAQLVEIRKASLSALFCNNGDYMRYIQRNSFVYPNKQNKLINCDSIPQMDLSKWAAAN